MARALTDEQIGIICECIQRPKLAIWADMGAGKTAITLHAIAELFRLGMITRAVVVAPRAVADSLQCGRIYKDAEICRQAS